MTVRTIYRDVATLQARRVPIEGEAGVGYVLRQGFDLPPLMFTVEEIEAVTVGARLVQRLRDRELQAAARRVLDKVTVVLPDSLRSHVDRPFYVSRGDAAEPRGIDSAELRGAPDEADLLAYRCRPAPRPDFLAAVGLDQARLRAGGLGGHAPPAGSQSGSDQARCCRLAARASQLP